MAASTYFGVIALEHLCPIVLLLPPGQLLDLLQPLGNLSVLRSLRVEFGLYKCTGSTRM